MTIWGWIGVFWAAFCILYILIRMAQAWIRESLQQSQQKLLCDAHRCDYFQVYLQKGPATLTHSQYHELVKSYLYWKNSLERCEDDDSSAPFYSNKMYDLYRRQARL